jgi:hypothetical protein
VIWMHCSSRSKPIHWRPSNCAATQVVARAHEWIEDDVALTRAKRDEIGREPKRLSGTCLGGPFSNHGHWVPPGSVPDEPHPSACRVKSGQFLTRRDARSDCKLPLRLIGLGEPTCAISRRIDPFKFGVGSIAMVIFLLAALAGYIACEPFVRWWSPHRETRWLRARHAVVLIALLLALGIALFAVVTGSLHVQSLRYVRRLLAASETNEAVLGAVAGIVAYTFPLWRYELNLGGTWGLIALASALGSIMLVAIIEPHLDSLTTFETPYAKFQFATPQAERQLQVEIQRDLSFFEGLQGVTGTDRIFQIECGYAAVKAGGFAAFERSPLYQDLGHALVLRNAFRDFLARVARAQTAGYDIDGLKRRVSPVADKFYALISGRWPARLSLHSIVDAYRDATQELRKQDYALATEGIGNPPANGAKAAPRSGQEADPERHWCAPLPEELSKQSQIEDLLENTRYVYGAVAVMFSFTGNTEGQIKTYLAARARPPLRDDINVNGSLADAMYQAERDFRQVSEFYEKALAAIDSQAADVANFCASPRSQPNDQEICQDLPRRYTRARLNVRRDLAYVWAQADMRWPTAEFYANQNLEDFRQGSTPQYECLDDYVPIEVKDTYSYVMLAFQAHNYRNDRITPNVTDVREARSLLEEAASELEAKQLEEDSPIQCTSHDQTKVWLRRVRSHLRLAEAMLR